MRKSLFNRMNGEKLEMIDDDDDDDVSKYYDWSRGW